MKPCLIEWLDAAVTEDRWSDLDEAVMSCNEPLISCKTMGFLFLETGVGTPRHTLHLTQTDGSNQVGPITHIPVCSVISRRELERIEDAESRDS
jgi:hypothetical protein